MSKYSKEKRLKQHEVYTYGENFSGLWFEYFFLFTMMLSAACLLSLSSVDLSNLLITFFTNISTTLFSGLRWLRQYTLADVWSVVCYSSAPVLWICLLFASTHDQNIFYYLDPDTASAAAKPSQPRPTHHYYKQVIQYYHH